MWLPSNYLITHPNNSPLSKMLMVDFTGDREGRGHQRQVQLLEQDAATRHYGMLRTNRGVIVVV